MNAEERAGLHRIWREAAETGMTTGIDWPRVARDLFKHIDRLTEDKEAAKAAWRSAADRAERAEADLAAVVAGVRAWCSINEIASPPLDWAGLGEFLARSGGDPQ